MNQPPTMDGTTETDSTAFALIPQLGRTLDRVQRVYGSGTRFPIFNDEYGYITSPPSHSPYVSPTTAANYLNWAEYLSWKNPRVRSWMQYPLQDPPPVPGQSYVGFSSGLLTFSDHPKPAYDAYRLPLFLPVTSTHHGGAVEVWGGVRPSDYAQLDTGIHQQVQIQFQTASSGPIKPAFTTVKTVNINNAHGYFDTFVTFPASGTMRLTWTYPSGPYFDPLAAAAGDKPIYSRSVQISVS